MTSTKETIIERVKKLLALSRDPSNEHQAAAAAEKAQQLLFDHNLSLDTIEMENDDSGYEKETVTVPRYDKSWRSLLYHHISTNNFCSAIDVIKSDKIYLIGKKSNIEVVNYLYTYLSRTIRDLALEAYHRAKEDADNFDQGRVVKTTFLRAFSLGAVAVIGKRLREARVMAEAKVNENERALVVCYKKELHDAVLKNVGQTKTYATRTSNYSAAALGRQAGHAIPLNQGIRGKNQRALT